MRHIALPLLILPTFALACKPIHIPTASIRSATLGHVDSEAVTLHLNLLVKNPNLIPIPLSNASYKLDIANARILAGTTRPAVTLSPLDTTPVTLPITLRWHDLLLVKSALTSTGGNIPYSLSATINLTSNFPYTFAGNNGTIPLHHAGILPLRDYLTNPQLLLRSPALKQLAKSLLSPFTH